MKLKQMLNKKALSGILVLLMLLLSMSTGLAASAAAASPSEAAAVSDVEIAGKLGVLLGEGQGLTAEYLAKPTTRLQAAIMYLRLKGLEKEAKKFQGSDNFADAGKAGTAMKPLLAYLKAHPELGWQGVGDNRFDPLAHVTVQQFYKVMLSALGYQAGTDFSYADTLSFASERGFHTVSNQHQFLNRDIATAAIQALSAKLKGSDKTLARSLVDAGVLQADQTFELSYTRLNGMSSPSLGDYLTDAHGMTLYYFTKDVADPNSCQGGCLQAWPIFNATDFQVPAGWNADDFSVFIRTDGKQQVAYKGWPLYYYIGDQKPGDTNGEDVNHVWFVIKSPAYTVAIGTNKELGNYLTDENGKTLYYFTKDTMNASNCEAGCLQAWPAFHADTAVVPTGLDPADFGEIKRADGGMQTTYKGYPLYYYIGDQQRGDVNGQDVHQAWYVIQPGKSF